MACINTNMAAIANTPTNKNFLSPLGFTFSIKKLPNVNYFVQTAEIPGITLGQADIQTPFTRLPVYGDHIEFGVLNITFAIDEDMVNYTELFNWINALGTPESGAQHKSVFPADRPGFQGTSQPMTGDGAYSDASLMVLNSVKAPVKEFVFKDLYPTSLTDVAFDVTATDVSYVIASVAFAFRNFTLNSV